MTYMIFIYMYSNYATAPCVDWLSAIHAYSIESSPHSHDNVYTEKLQLPVCCSVGPVR